MDTPPFDMPADDALTTTASGLKYVIHDAGEGTGPSASDKVTVHYAGWLPDGKLFDASYSRGEPIAFGLNQVIAGWTEGVQLLKPGGKGTFVIPADLGYGDRGAPPMIPPGATLVFHVELLKVG